MPNYRQLTEFWGGELYQRGNWRVVELKPRMDRQAEWPLSRPKNLPLDLLRTT